VTTELAVQLPGRLRAVTIDSFTARGVAAPRGRAPGAESEAAEALRRQLADQQRRMEQQLDGERTALRQACRAASAAAKELEHLRADLVTETEEQLAALAVDIARRVLFQEIRAGRHEIDPIVAEALEHAPVREDVTVRLNPQDHARCAAAAELPDNGGHVRFLADPAVPPAECVLETSEGTIESSVEAKLARVAEALTQPE